MGVCTLDGKDGEAIKSTMEMLVRFCGEISPRLTEWEERLRQNPAELEVIEQEAANEYLRGAGMLLAGLVSVVMQTKEFAETSEQTRREFGTPLAKGRIQKLSIRMLGGIMMWVTSLYCEPKRGVFRQPDDGAVGLHIELAQFGFGKKESPGVESRISRLAALCPSFELAREEADRNGLSMSTGAVRRVAQQCSDDLLKLRTLQLQQWRAGSLESTNELAGKCVTVQIDGGRTRLRAAMREFQPEPEKLNDIGLVISDAPGRSKPRAKRTFDAAWREPKLVTIFIHDDKGRMVKDSKATIDGTFTGPDAMAELVAMHLHRLGAAKAQSVTFVSDGAVWIWDRIDAIVKQAGIPETVSIHQVLDNCHAAHHISLALASMEIPVENRMPSYRDLRTRLRNGQWRYVVKELQQHADANPDNLDLVTEIAYLTKHGEAGRLSYLEFKRQGLPLGSGAIESSIRRVINMRLKNNGTFWREENAESMLQLRALVISDRWDERVRLMRQRRKSVSLTGWRWTPQPMSSNSELESKTPKNTA